MIARPVAPDPGASPRSRRGSRPPAAFVSLYTPTGRRRQWWYAYRCDRCGRHQLGRARELENVTGQRRAGCGHQVSIIIARVYGERPA